MTRVLVVEDEESYSDALSYLLRKEGFEVAVAGDGNAALEDYDRSGADLVLLDLMLPGLPGTEVCRQLRVRGNVPVIMLTAKDSEIDKVVGLEARGFILGGGWRTSCPPDSCRSEKRASCPAPSSAKPMRWNTARR